MVDNSNIKIPTGGMFQEWECLSEVVDENIAKNLELLANTKGWRIAQPDEAKLMGFEELADWSEPETDSLILIDKNYLVCLKKEEFLTDKRL